MTTRMFRVRPVHRHIQCAPRAATCPAPDCISTLGLVCPGDALAHVEGCGLAARVIPLVQVFARVSPEQKELVLQVSMMLCI
jgi:magnesium-transporting ATPase (P-type)